MSAKRNDGMPSRTEKLVSLTYALMYRKRGYTKDELRSIVDDYQGLSDDAFERKFERDKEDLRALGVPLETLAGETAADTNRQESRYRILPEQYRLPAVSFNAEEAFALALAAKVWKDPTIETAAARAFDRLAVGSRPDAAAALESFEPRLHAGDAVFRDLLHAVWDRVPVRFDYRPVNAAEATRRVEPWGIGNRFGHWYLVGWDIERAGQRIYRLSRITTDIARLPGQAERPDGFSVKEVLDGLDPGRSSTPATVLLRPGRGLALRNQALPAEPTGMPNAAGTPARVGAPVPPAEADAPVPPPAADDGLDSAAAAGYDAIRFVYHDAEATSAELAELGAAARVRGPAELRTAVVRRLRDALAAQERTPPAYTLRANRGTGRPPATDVVARALDIIAYVVREGAPRIDATAEHFGLTRRRLIDDLTMIQMCGVPNGLPDELIDVDLEGDRVSIANAEGLAAPIRLNLIEAFSLVVGLQAILDLPALRADRAARSALRKLEQAAGEFGDISAFASARLAATEESAARTALERAVADSSVLRLRYYNLGRDEIRDREVEPLRLIEDDGRTYLQAWCRQAGGLRNFRLDRILGAEPTGERFARRDAGGGAPGERIYTPGADDAVVVLGFAPRLHRLAEEFAPHRTAKAADGTLYAQVGIAAPEQLPALVARHGGDLSVAEPGDLAGFVRSWLREALASYEEEA